MSKNLSPREAAKAAIERQAEHIERLRTDHAAGRATKAQLDEAVAHGVELYRKALEPGRRLVASFADGVLTEYEPLPEVFIPVGAERRSAPKGTRTPASTPTAAQRAKVAAAAKELQAWHQRRAATALKALADLESRLNTR